MCYKNNKLLGFETKHFFVYFTMLSPGSPVLAFLISTTPILLPWSWSELFVFPVSYQFLFHTSGHGVKKQGLDNALQVSKYLQLSRLPICRAAASFLITLIWSPFLESFQYSALPFHDYLQAFKVLHLHVLIGCCCSQAREFSWQVLGHNTSFQHYQTKFVQTILTGQRHCGLNAMPHAYLHDTLQRSTDHVLYSYMYQLQVICILFHQEPQCMYMDCMHIT